MNNLKRILSLALASVMVMGMMVVGASAADFKDDEDITHKAAVDTMDALNIIGGYEDGSFRPNGDVTRAEMAKMITFALNGGKDVDMGLKNSGTFTDVKSTDWFAEDVEYCASLGIIGGKGNGIFDPYGRVTAAEAAKMILVALGFDAEIFQLGGPNWSKNTMTLAQNLRVGTDAVNAKTLNLFNGLSIGPNTPLNRDQAAQLIYNGIQSNTVLTAVVGVTGGSLTDILGSLSGQRPSYDISLTGDSLLKSKFKAEMKEGILSDATYVSTAKAWSYTVAGVGTFTSTKDISDQFKQTVRVIYKTGTGSRKTLLAITAASNDVVETCPWGDLDIDTDDDTLNGYELKAWTTTTTTKDNDGNDITTTTDHAYTIATLPVYDFLGGEVTNGLANTTKKDYAQAQLIDNDHDGRIDCVVVTDINWTTVSAVRPTYLQLKNVATNVTLASNDVEEGLEAGDYVTYTRNPQTGVYTVKKAEIVTGLMNSSMIHTVNDQGKWTRPDQLQLAGEWYIVVDGQFSTLKNYVGKEAALVLISGYVVTGYPIQEAAVSSNAVMVVAKAKAVTTNNTNVDAASTYLEIRVLKADNTTEVLRATTGTSTAIAVGDVTEGKLYTYRTNPAAPGCVILSAYNPSAALVETNNTNPDYYDKITGSAISISNGVATAGTKSFRFDPDAKIFVLVGNGVAPANAQDTTNHLYKYAVVSGAEVNKWGTLAVNGDAANSVLYADRASNGFTYAQEGALVYPTLGNIPGASGDKVFYGYVTANSYYTIVNNKTYIAVPLWNGIENVTVLAEKKTNTTTNIAQDDEAHYLPGNLVSYQDNGDGTANSLKKLNAGSAADELAVLNDALIAWDGIGTAKFLKTAAGRELKIDDKTTVLYIDGTKRAGIPSGNITIADYVDAYMPAKGFKGNVRYIHAINNDGQAGLDYVDVLIMESVGSLGMMGGETTEFTPAYTATQAQVEAAVKNLNNGVYTVDPAIPGVHAMLAALDGIGTEANITFFKFACDGGVKYTLTVSKSDETTPTVKETKTMKADGTVGVFYYNSTTFGIGSYTYSIKAENGAEVDAGSFEITTAVDTGLTPAAIKNKEVGTYKATEIGAAVNKEEVSNEAIENLIFFVFEVDAADAGKDCVLEVKDSDNTKVYTETLPGASAGKHYFVMDKRAGKASGATTDLTSGGSYTVTISNAKTATFDFTLD